MWVPTFDNAGQFFHVVMCFAVVNHRRDREDQFGLDLRKPVEDALRERETERERVKKKKELIISAREHTVSMKKQEMREKKMNVTDKKVKLEWLCLLKRKFKH